MDAGGDGGGVSQHDDYSVNFTVDGTMTVIADSPEDAERQAVDILESLDIMDAEDSAVDGCTVRVSMRFDTSESNPTCEKLDRASKVVDFA